MNNETKLTAADLALCLGGEVDWMGKRGYFLAGINTGQNNFDPVGLVSEHYVSVWVKYDEVIPILRPLSDMTEDEEKEFVPLAAGSQISFFRRDTSGACASNWMCWIIEFENGDIDHLVMNETGETWFASYFKHDAERRNWSNTVNQHKQTVWLIRHRFDPFGWIGAGLAIDKTKIETP